MPEHLGAALPWRHCLLEMTEGLGFPVTQDVTKTQHIQDAGGL